MSVTPLGDPDEAVLNPVRTALVVPSNVFSTLGNSNMRWVSEAPSVSTNRVEKSLGAA
jgi:hypothetical protein